MSLISILSYAVAALTVLAGLSLLVGSAKADRVRIAWFFAAAISAAVWIISVACFQSLPPDASEMWTRVVIGGIYISGAMLMVTLLAFAAWETAIGKALVIIAMVYVAVMVALVLRDKSLFFEGYTLLAQGNTVHLVNGPGYWSYMAFFIVNSVVVWISLLRHSRKARLKRVKQGDYVLLGGLMVTGILSCVFDVILPLWVRYDLIWIGPVAVGVSIVAFYYALLRFRIISMSSSWLKVLSSIVLTSAGVIIYMLIFYLIFTSLFKIPNPSTSILVLNFLMIVIMLLLMPVINELRASISSMISVGQVDIAYVVKKLNHLATKNIDLRDLAGFLADHLHFAYIGFIINGRLYGSKALAMSSEELSQITHLKPSGTEIWQQPNKQAQKTFDELGLKAVAELRNAKGKAFGQLVVGKPMGKNTFERRDLIQLEMIINLVATVIDSEKHLRA